MNIIKPADATRARQYDSISPQAAKFLMPDGSVTDALPSAGGGQEIKSIVKSKQVSLDGAVGEVSWIELKISDKISIVSFFGKLAIDSAYTERINILSITDEPLFQRFIGTVHKLAMLMDESQNLVAIFYEYTSEGIIFQNALNTTGTADFQDVLFFIDNS